jgi:V8-like Glu-specific endopeptidase
VGVPAQRPFYDWGSVVVDCSYADLGNFGLTTVPPNIHDAATVTGYPCNLPDPEIGEQYTSMGKVLGLESFLLGGNLIVSFDAHIAGCNSGSPVYTSTNNMVYATVTEGYIDKGKGTLITEAVFDGLKAAARIKDEKIYLPLATR